ncbi:rpsI, partial [Symbiodinium pilosum]
TAAFSGNYVPLTGKPRTITTVQRASAPVDGHAQGSQSSIPAITGMAASLALLGTIRAHRKSSRKAQTLRKAEITTGTFDPVTGKKNYVNPWEERVDLEKDLPPDAGKIPFGRKFRPYRGPVYKQVPVIEGLEFPLDPNLYYPPLEPPAPGAKWGDGRAPDGNWYMDVQGEEVQYWQGVGKRKTACAIVRIVKGNGQFIVNGKDAITYFCHYPYWWLKACEPLAALSQKNKFDIIAKSFGGGVSGQAGAIRLALARAMQEYNFNWRPMMKKARYLTRDWRMVEPKKPGQPKARRKTPFHKR